MPDRNVVLVPRELFVVPCGVAEPRFGVTSLRDLGRAATLPQVDAALRREFEAVFGPVRSDPS